ncbi:hypothetical protein BKD30_08135 [Tersicoccus phoenicis]|uniref:Uncharacterized protein n=1 Tax=Tersicoccus phoenicis TaxID=554083 RepID=A0A1R1LAJ6_9MICC|nr:hypothetical protein BKD30_08135 [Tersicoccus phoenicis]
MLDYRRPVQLKSAVLIVHVQAPSGDDITASCPQVFWSAALDEHYVYAPPASGVGPVTVGRLHSDEPVSGLQITPLSWPGREPLHGDVFGRAWLRLGPALGRSDGPQIHVMSALPEGGER